MGKTSFAFLLITLSRKEGFNLQLLFLTRDLYLSQGLIDVEKEVTKLMAKKGDLEKQIEKLSEKISKSDYKEKVPLKVQEQDTEKVGKVN